MTKKTALPLIGLFLAIGIVAAGNIVVTDGVYFTDATQEKLYNGDYREYHDNGNIRAEIYIVNGRPEGQYVIYYPDGRPHEIRSYRNGKPHGCWRMYNQAGTLVSEANYHMNVKHDAWRIWNDNDACAT